MNLSRVMKLLSTYLSSERLPFTLWISLCLLLFLIFNLTYTGFVWLSLIFKPFMHGVSSFKTNFLLVYTLILSLIILSGKTSISQRSLVLYQKLSYGSITAGGIAGLWTFTNVVQALSLPFGKYTYHFKNHYNTINYFAHTHSTKVPLYYLAKLLRLIISLNALTLPCPSWNT